VPGRNTPTLQIWPSGKIGRSASSIYLKIEIQMDVTWRVEILNDTVAAEIAVLPADMQARFLRLSERIGQAGLESLEHDPEKWAPVFRKDHAQSKR
jgi:hypothetical protein